MFGMDTLNTAYPVYCDHYHMYSFSYDTVTLSGTVDKATDLIVTGWAMSGVPIMCEYIPWSAL